jgi:hypothetical protein
MKAVIDPTGHFESKGVEKGRLVEACGLIPGFVAFAERMEAETAREVYDYMVKEYGFGGFEWSEEEHHVDTGTGVYSYPDDPDLYPLVLLEVDGCDVDVYIYQHAIVSIVGDDETIVCRMD